VAFGEFRPSTASFPAFNAEEPLPIDTDGDVRSLVAQALSRDHRVRGPSTNELDVA
jgi:hypothetical protein